MGLFGYITRGKKKIPCKVHRIHNLEKGDIITKIAGGGAGVGNPLERDPEKVREDVLNELVSLKAAKDLYKVVLDPKTRKVNIQATRKLRI